MEVELNVNDAACRLFEYAWSRAHLRRAYLPAAIRAMCMTLAENIDGTSQLMRRIISEEGVGAHKYDGLFDLVQNVDQIAKYNPQLVADIYTTIVPAGPAPDTSVDWGDSQILRLTSTLRQDFQSTKYWLGKGFGKYLEAYPSFAIPALCEIMRQRDIRKKSRTSENLSSTFTFRNRQAVLVSDLSSIWDQGDLHGHDPEFQMLSAFEQFLARVLLTPSDYAACLDLIAEHNTAAITWRRLLRFGASHPDAYASLVELAKSTSILECIDTNEECGKYLNVAYSSFATNDRQQIEAAILAIPEMGRDQRAAYKLRTRDRLISQLPPAFIVTEDARAIYESLNSGEQQGSISDFPIERQYPSSDDDWYSEYQERQGIPVREPQNSTLIQAMKPISNFAQKFLNRSPTPEDVAEIWQSLVDLAGRIENGSSHKVDPSIINGAIGSVAAACKCIARSESAIAPTGIFEFVRKWLLEASTNPSPDVAEANNAQFDNTPHWSSGTARLEAAQGLPYLLRISGTQDKEVAEAVRTLSRDTANCVRFMIAERLGALCTFAPELFWELAERFAAIEESHPILVALVTKSFWRIDTETQRIANLVWDIFRRVGESASSRDAGECCAQLFVSRFVKADDRDCEKHLFSALSNLRQHASKCEIVAASVRDYIAVPGSTDRVKCPEDVRVRAWRVLRVLAANSSRLWTEIRDDIQKQKMLDANFQVNQPTLDLQQSLYKILDSIALDLNLASGAFDHKQSGQIAGEVMKDSLEHSRFLKNALPLVSDIMQVGLAAVAHNLVEFLAAYVAVAPKDVFLVLCRVVLSAESGGYAGESIAADQIVRTVEQYIAEYRYLLRENADCQEQLIKVLDCFVGWPAALKLSYRLGEVYR